MEYHFSTREKNGSVCLVLSYKVNHLWRQKTKQGFRTKREARSHQDELLAAAKKEAEAGASPELSGITLWDFTEKVYLRDRRSALQQATIMSYRYALKAMPSIAGMSLKEITEAEVINAYNAMEIEASTKNNHLAKIAAVFAYAVKTYHLRVTNPCHAVARLKNDSRTKINAFTKQESRELLDSVKGRPLFHAVIMTALCTGMRYGEIAGLTWDDVSFIRKTIRINKQWGLLHSNRYGFKVPKTKHSYRTLHMPSSLAAELLEWRAVAPKDGTNRIFCELPTKKLSIRRAIEAYKPGMTFHSLRHTFATMLLSETQDINLVGAVLGDNPSTVAKTYIHYTQDIREKANHYIDEMLL